MISPQAVPPANAGGQLRLLHGLVALMAGALLTLLATFVLAIPPAYAQTFPKFTGFVVDAADILTPEAEAQLTQKLDALQRDTKRQLIVATIPSLEDYPIEEYGYQLGRAWGVGLTDVNNGAILLVAPNDRKVRVEVGYGLEPFLTDAYSSVVINQQILPRFKAGDMEGGVVAGTDALITQLRASPEEAQARLEAAVQEFDRANKAGSGDKDIPIGLVFWGMVAVFVILSLARRGFAGGAGSQRYRGDGGISSVILWNIAANVASAALRGGDDDDDWGGGFGGGSGGGGWGGGGFGGGGGGSFGGGGASGSW